MSEEYNKIMIEPEEPEREESSRWQFHLPRPCMQEWIVRLIAAYLSVLACHVWLTPGEKFTEQAFGASLIETILFTAVFFLLYTLIDIGIGQYIRPDGWYLLCATVSYGTILAFRANDTMTSVVICLLACFATAFLVRSGMLSLPFSEKHAEDGTAHEAREVPRWFAWALVGICFAACALYIGAVTVIRYLIYYSPNFDFGIFVNMFHNMAETGLPNTTCERDGFLSHFAVHFSPIYYLLLPAYLIFPSGITLQIGQAVVCASGVFPLYRIVRGRGLSRMTAVAFCAAYVLFPALSGSCMYDIHENCFLAPLLLWTIDAALRDQKVRSIVFALLTCLIKEDAPVYVAFLGIYLLVSEKETRRKVFGGGILALGIGYFLGVSAFLAAYGEGIMAWRYQDYSSDGGLVSVILTVVRNPGLVIHHLASEKKLTYIFQTLVPLAFLPLMTAKPSRLVLLGPYILINLMPSYVYQHDIYFQYNYGSFAFLIVAAVLNFADMAPKSRKTALPCLLMTSLIMFTGTTYTAKYYYFGRYEASQELREEMEEAIACIPEDASVVSSTFILPHVAYRAQIYPMNTEHMDLCEYAIVDLRYGKEIKNNTYGYDYRWLEKNGWETILFTEGTVAVYRNPDYVG